LSVRGQTLSLGVNHC